jgi:pyridoxal/pyridoxine/pyridoxamine kinase
MGFLGDLMTALLLAWLEKHPRNLRHAVESALAGLQGVLQRTHEMSGLTSGATEKTAEVLPIGC